MAKATLAPAGYCPHCDYRIDPGVCPECGASVEAKELRHRPKRRRLRRWIKRTVFTLTLVALAFLGQRFYQSDVWMGWFSTSFLLSQQPSTNWTRAELFRRLNKGTLNGEEIFDLVSVYTPVTINAVSPHPIDVPLCVRITVDPVSGPGGLSSTVTTELRLDDIYVDGRLHQATNILFQNVRPGGETSNAETFDPSELGVGSHDIEYRGTLSVTLPAFYNGQQFPGTSAKHPFRMKRTVEIVDQPATRMFSPKYDDLLAGEVADAIGLRVWSRPHRNKRNAPTDPEKLHLLLCCRDVPVTIAGKLRVYIADTDVLIDETPLRIRSDVHLPRYEFELSFPESISAESAWSIDVIFEPDAAEIFAVDNLPFFAARMEWKSLTPIVRGRFMLIDDCSMPFTIDQRPYPISQWEVVDDSR